MNKIAYNITIGANQVSSTNAGLLISVETNLSLNVPVNSCYIMLNSGEIEINIGDPVVVDLGYGDTTLTIFTGKVFSCNFGISTISIEVLSSFSGLLSNSFNLIYEQQNSSDIISDVLGLVNIETDTIEPGITFPIYYISDADSIYNNLKKISTVNGQDFYANESDKAVSKMYVPANQHILKYAYNIITFDYTKSFDNLSGVEVYGESPVGQGQSEDAVSWFTKNDVKGVSGDTSGKVLRLQDPSARDIENAQTFSQNILKKISKSDIVETTIIGNQDIKLCDAAMVMDMPVNSYNTVYKIISIQHIVSISEGFISNLILEKVS